MKKSIILFVCFFIGASVYGQVIDVPEKVLSTFQEKYPEADEVDWKQRKETFQAEFFDFYQGIAIFNADGLWIKTIMLVSEEELPEKAFEYLDEKYDVSQITQIQQIENNKSLISFKVVIEDEDEKTTFEFQEDGSLVKISK